MRKRSGTRASRSLSHRYRQPRLSGASSGAGDCRNFAQLLLLLLFGHLVYGLKLGDSPLASITVAIVVVSSMTCFAAVVAAFVRTREQTIPVGLAISFILASLGGLFWPLYDLPRTIQTVARALMTTWSMSAIQDVILRARSLAEVSNELLVLLAYGLLSFLFALWLFRYGKQVV